ncbi:MULTISPECIES: RrF2 family transcriptional regulator [Micrococcaceae]|uniref:RrF2 family transcriptional regulator n=1 Tax=unclassified Kocuria TaxID=2649579 RepID=UPI001013BC98|nr:MULTISPECIES: Rrf2 family transcriptional regulator [unclassified Kocuria]
MRLTAFSDVTLRVMMLLSATESGTKLTSAQIADGVGTPYNHVTKSVTRLSSLGLVDASRGRGGGVSITAVGLKETVGHLLRELERDQAMVECEASSGTCPMDHDCHLRSALRRAREAFYAELDDVIISELPHRRQMGPIMIPLGLEPPPDCLV